MFSSSWTKVPLLTANCIFCDKIVKTDNGIVEFWSTKSVDIPSDAKLYNNSEISVAIKYTFVGSDEVLLVWAEHPLYVRSSMGMFDMTLSERRKAF